jgi:hypothetical protein
VRTAERVDDLGRTPLSAERPMENLERAFPAVRNRELVCFDAGATESRS